MALYEYECDEGHTVELRRKLEERNDRVMCPHCGEIMKRPLSAFSYTGETQRQDRRRMYITPKAEYEQKNGGSGRPPNRQEI